MSKYAGKKVVVTGGTTGIGLGTAKALLVEGAEVLVTGQNEKNLEATRRELGARAHVVRSDTTSLTDIDALAGVVHDKLGQVDLLFINAGYSTFTLLADMTERDYERTFGVNTKGALFTVQRLAPYVRDGGAIVFTTSIADEIGYPGLALYSGAKAAVRSFVRVLAAELAGRQIRVNALSPGYVRTPTMGMSGISRDKVAAFADEGVEVTPLKRIATVEEVARAVLFLGFEATFTTGAEVPIDGGLGQL